MDHALSCHKGGLPFLRHNEIRDLIACLLTGMCYQVQVEPVLQPVSNPGSFALSTANTQEGAHLDIAMSGSGGGVGRNAVLWMLESLIPFPPPM